MSNLSRRDFLKITAITSGAVVGIPLLARLLGQSLVSVQETRVLMGTIVHLTVVAPNEAEGQMALNATFSEMERLIAMFDHREASTALGQLNISGRLLNAPIEVYQVVQQALDLSQLSDGAFDISIKPIVDAFAAGQQPTAAEFDLVDYRKISLGVDQIHFETPGMQVTLDGIAKGYIVDQGVAILEGLGFDQVIVEAGGDLMAQGSRPDGNPWRVGVAHPRPASMDGYLASFSLVNAAAATSGDYIHAYTEDNSQHHILDPRTGISPPELASVTVIAKNAMTADALSTTVMILGADQGLALINTLDNTEALVVAKDLQIKRTNGFPSSI